MRKRWIAAALALILLLGLFPMTAVAAQRDVSQETTMAAVLKQLGLFKGVSDVDFALGRAPTRDEALVMLIRLLGKEDEAVNGTWRHPFTDVAVWAEPYVGYAYQHDLTNGVSATEFGSGEASCLMYLTFVLRALGYSDVDELDFTWQNPFDLANAVGILPEGVDRTNFWRADVVRVSYAALAAKMKGSDTTLGQTLMEAGVFTQSKYDACYGKAVPSGMGDGQEIYARCSPAVFCVETQDSAGDALSLGSGFFIDKSGIAVTNFHVLEGASGATAALVDGKVCRVEGVIAFDAALDYAVIKVEGKDFPTLEIGNSDSVQGGQRVYAIGNPQGLTNTISDGVVSNPRRDDFDGMIQISVPISPGSSGGALLNTAGAVIGITTGSITSGQNLNFAVPIGVVGTLDTLKSIYYEYGLWTVEEAADYGGGQDEGDRREECYYALRDWLIQNTSKGATHTGEYVEREESGNDTIRYTLYYNDQTSTEYMTLKYQCIDIEGTEILAYIALEPEGTWTLTSYSYYWADNTTTTADTYGKARIDIATFGEDYDYRFDTVEGDTSDLYYDQNIAKYACISLLEFADQILQSKLDGGYSIKDLGYISLYD